MTTPNKLKEKILLFKIRRNRDTEAFGELYDLYVDSIYRYVFFKISSREDAEDLASEVFLKIWNYLVTEESDRINNFRPFAYKVARNLVTDFYRKNKHIEIPIDSENDTIIDNQKNIFDKLAIASEVEEVSKAMKELKSEYREVILLRHVESLNIGEIASVIGKTNGATRTLLHRATGTLREILNQENEQRS